MKHFIPNKDVNDSSLNYGRSESFFLNQSMDSEYYGGKKVKFLKYKPKERKGHHA